MNNFVIGLKRFFTNKNVVTIILVIVILVVLYYGYSGSIKQKTDPVTVPVAARKIGPQTKLTSDDITYVQVANSMVSKNALRYVGDIIDKYTNVNVTIPEGSMFYSEWLDVPENIPGNWIEQIDRASGDLGYYMSVSIESTLGKSVLPNSYIDIYMKAFDENGTIIFGKLMKNVKVLVVHDSAGNNIFANPDEIGVPAKIGFAVNKDMYILLKKAEFLNLELVLAPRGSEVPAEDYAIVTSATLRDYIDAQTITVDDEVITDTPNTEQEAS